jgi:hypothetical protein
VNELVDFHEIKQTGHAIEDDFNAIIFNRVASTILKRYLSQIDVKVAPVSLGLPKVTYGNNRNHNFVVSHLKPHLCNSGSHG